MTHTPHGESPEGDGLLPCPFCGFAGGHYTGLHHVQRASDPYRGKTDFWIQCPNCGATVPARRADHAEERSWDLAVERWNRRAAPASPEGGPTGLERTQDQLEIALREGDEALRLMSQYAREAGEAKGRLEMSEAAGIVDGWRERTEAAEAREVRLRATALAVTEDASPNSDGALRLGGDATVKAELILALRMALLAEGPTS